MEGLRGVETLLVYVLGFGVVLAAIAVWIIAWRWSWKQRGKGFAEGWFEVAERRARGTAVGALSGVPSSGPAERRSVSLEPTLPLSTPAPERTKRAPVGPPRYLVPTEKE
jgi:hypothetical protein